MRKKWPTKKQDLQAAAEIINDNFIIGEGEPLSMFNLIFDDKAEDADFCVSDWVLELADYFVETYGIKKGKVITNKVLTKCMLSGQTIH